MLAAMKIFTMDAGKICVIVQCTCPRWIKYDISKTQAGSCKCVMFKIAASEPPKMVMKGFLVVSNFIEASAKLTVHYYNRKLFKTYKTSIAHKKELIKV